MSGSTCIFHVMYQSLAQMFDHISKHRKQNLKNEAQPSFLTKVRGVWKHDQTLVQVFDTTSQTNMYFRKKRRRNFGKFMQVFDHISKPVRHTCDFPLS